MSGSTFEAGKGSSTGEIVEKSFAVPGITLRVRTRPAVFGDVFEELPVWLARDQDEEGAPVAWVGVDTEEVLDEKGEVQTRVLGNILMLNAARLQNQTGIARILRTLTKSHDADFAAATAAVKAAAAEVGIREAEEEAAATLFLNAAADVQSTWESSRQLALAAVREAFQLTAAKVAPADSSSSDASRPSSSSKAADAETSETPAPRRAARRRR